MSCPENNNCIPCQSLVPCETENCTPVNYTDTLCDVSYPFKCSYWTGSPISCLNILTGDTGDVIISKLMAAICNNTFASPDEKFKISSTDTTSGYFATKIQAGTNITLVKTNSGANEVMTINASFTQTPLVITSSANTISYILSGTANHTADLNVNISSDTSNLIVAHSNGLYATSTSKVKISSTDTTEDYLISKLIAGTNISIVKLNNGANEQYQISSVAGGILGVTSTNTSTITITGTGTSGSPLVVNSNISTNSSNILSYDSTGLLVLPSFNNKVKVSSGDTQTDYLEGKIQAGSGIVITKLNTGAIETLSISSNITTNVITANSSSISFTGNGTSGSNLTASTIISGNANNILTNASGLYVPKTFMSAGTNTSLSGIGTSLNPYIVSFTGILPIANGGTGSSTQGWVDLATDQNNINGVKTFIGTSLKVTNLLQINSTDTTASLSSNNTTLNNSISGVTTRVIDNTGLIYNGVYGQMYITNSYTFTHTTLRNITGTSGVVYFNNTGNITLYTDTRTAYSGLNGVVYGGNTGNVIGDFINGISSNAYFSSTGNYANVAGIKLSNPSLAPATDSYTGNITNYYAVYIPDIASSDITARITNKYGIYQAGTTAQNYFGGVSTFASGGFDSDMRLKTLIENAPIVKNIGLLKSKSYTKDGQFHIGYFAQEVQKVIPSAIITKADGFLSVAYHEVHTAKIEYLENKIQELENLLKSK